MSSRAKARRAEAEGSSGLKADLSLGRFLHSIADAPSFGMTEEKKVSLSREQPTQPTHFKGAQDPQPSRGGTLPRES